MNINEIKDSVLLRIYNAYYDAAPNSPEEYLEINHGLYFSSFFEILEKITYYSSENITVYNKRYLQSWEIYIGLEIMYVDPNRYMLDGCYYDHFGRIVQNRYCKYKYKEDTDLLVDIVDINDPTKSLVPNAVFGKDGQLITANRYNNEFNTYKYKIVNGKLRLHSSISYFNNLCYEFFHYDENGNLLLVTSTSAIVPLTVNFINYKNGHR